VKEKKTTSTRREGKGQELTAYCEINFLPTRTEHGLGELIGKVWSLLRRSCDYRFFLLPAIGVWKPTMTEKSSIEADAWEDRYWRDPFEPGLLDADVSLGISAFDEALCYFP
jgi:hypothetical protein